jgi:dUTPase
MYDSDRLQKLKEGQSITLSPGDTAIILTREKIMMPEDNSLSALIVSKVSMVARGFSGISTKVDPGWSDNLRITVHNLSRRKLTLDFEEPFCTIVFINNVSPEKHKHTKRDPNPLGVPYKGKRTFPWGYVLPLLVLVIPGIVYYMKGEGTALTLSVPISIFITQTLINALK